MEPIQQNSPTVERENVHSVENEGRLHAVGLFNRQPGLERELAAQLGFGEKDQPVALKKKLGVFRFKDVARIGWKEIYGFSGLDDVDGFGVRGVRGQWREQQRSEEG